VQFCFLIRMEEYTVDLEVFAKFVTQVMVRISGVHGQNQIRKGRLDLMIAVQAVLKGERFVSSSLCDPSWKRFQKAP
jgi:hypothetical protein